MAATSSMDDLLSHLSNTGIGPSTWWNKLARAIEEADGEEIWLDLTCQGCARIPAHPSSSSSSSGPQPVPEIVVVEADADDLVSDIGFYSYDRHYSPPPPNAKAPIVRTTTSATVTPFVASSSAGASSSPMPPQNDRLPHLLIHRKAHVERAAARDHRGRLLHRPLTRSTLLGPRFDGEVKEEGEEDDEEEQDKQVDGFMDAVVQSCFYRSSSAGHQLMMLQNGGEAPAMKEAFSSGALLLEEEEECYYSYPPLHPFRLGEPSPVEGTFIVTKDDKKQQQQQQRVQSQSRSRRRAMMQDPQLVVQLNTQPTRNSI
jgi:hypothetical protein